MLMREDEEKRVNVLPTRVDVDEPMSNPSFPTYTQTESIAHVPNATLTKDEV